ncbi:IclR family transcriptional regulator [Actinoalloteichus spitiensis]|uniref:IclR family transcriptional regulator n=1 Tax=Actinoalloteichus spitiensis TaxID=252394 RepID=UPI001FDFC50A|nr:helix-turn-helix domain-containing protein [Actinoalloteichus spitiensis]
MLNEDRRPVPTGSPADSAPPPGAKTLDTGLRILWALRNHPDGLTHAELTRTLGIERTAVYRLIGTLQSNRLVTRTERGRYQLALGVLELGTAVLPHLRRALAPELRTLAENCGATAFVTVLDGETSCVVVAVTEPSRTFTHVAYRVGTRHEAGLGAAGMAILAGRPPKLDERAEVTAARDRGYSVTSGELQPGAWGLAAPITPSDGLAVASVGIVSIGALAEAAVAPEVLRVAKRLGRTVTGIRG